MEATCNALRALVPVTDEDFDRVYADKVRRMSKVHWTPVSVALRAAELLAPEPGMRILDVGSGVGKLCCIGALATRSSWHGVERDALLVAAARETAISLAVNDRTRFIVGDMMKVDWTTFNAIYFYNPFEAALFAPGLVHRPTDNTGRWTEFHDEVSRAEDRLSEMPPGSRVVTYHGFGGQMPSSYQRASSEQIGSDQLDLWIKQPRP